MTYKGVLLQDVPNMAWIIGYTNAPWTLKADLAAHYICRLLQHMDRQGIAVSVAKAPDGEMQQETILGDLSSGYVQRAADTLPRQGRELPWRVLHSYERDRPMLLDQPVDDGLLSFTPARQPQPQVAPVMAAA